MCRPLHASWVNGKAYAVAGEGSHTKIEEVFWPSWGIETPDGHIQIGARNFGLDWTSSSGEKPEPLCLHPFETRWTQERVALWQPNTARFYKLEDVPTKKQFDMAQEQFDRDMGTWEKARDWILAAVGLYGRKQLIDCTDGVGQWLCDAANGLLKPDAQIAVAIVMVRESYDQMRPHVRDGFLSTLGYDTSKDVVTLRPLSYSDSTCVRIARPCLFDEWAERFSERKNRVELWAN